MRLTWTKLLLAAILSLSPAAGQQITLNFPALGNYNPPPASIGPLAGTIKTSPGGGTVTLTTPTSFLWFTTASCSSGDRKQTLTITTTANVAKPVSLCLIGLPEGGEFFALVSATAPGFPAASAALDVISDPGGLVIASRTSVTIPTAQPGVTFTNGSSDNLTLMITYAPNNTSWLLVTDADPAHPCSAVANGSCTVNLAVNPNATGLSAGSTYTAQVAYMGGGSIAGVAVTYTYTPAALRFIPITPCRIADTRSGAPPILAAGTRRSFTVTGGACGVPASAQAYSMNITVVPPASLGYLTVWPSGQSQPTASTLNSDGRVKANAAVVEAGSGGAVSVFASDNTHVILDVNGYFVPSSTTSALAFYPLTPCRIVDTRGAPSTFGGPMLGAGTSRDFPLRSSNCSLPASAQAYSLNFTAVPPGGIGFLTAWPTGAAQPAASTLNAPLGKVTANAAFVQAGTNGGVSVYTSDNTDLIVDVNGYFAPAAANGLSFYNQSPCRIIDTRTGAGQFQGELDVNFETTACGLPAAANAFVTNATVVPAGGLGFLTLWPQGQAQPLASTLNSDGSVTSNMAVVPTTNGSISSYASDPTNLILDVSGYFAP